MRVFIFAVFILPSLATFAQNINTDDLFDDVKLRFGLYDYSGCVEACDKLLKVDPRNGNAYYFRAFSKLILGDLFGAELDIKYAKADPDEVKIDRGLKFWLDEDKKLKALRKFFYKNETLYPELGNRPKYTRRDTLRGALRPERNCYDVTFYNLNITINPKKKRIKGAADITFKVKQPSKTIQVDLFERYKILSVRWKKQLLTYRRECDALFISFPTDLPLDSTETLTIEWEGKPVDAPNPPWDGGFVWKKDKKDNYWCGVACERFGASSWWPCKDHPSDEPDSALLTFNVPNGYDLISNGRLRTKKPAMEGYTAFSWFVANPINTYNITFYLGKFSHFSDTIFNASGKYPLDYYVLPDHFDDAVKCFAQAKDILRFYEKAYGEFPFMNDKFCMVESPYEGMEHQGAIAYGNEFNKKEKDQVYINKKYDYIIVHETAHEWWGNSVTARDMADIWIQEGFATYAEMMFMEEKYGPEVYLKEMKRKMMDIYNVWPLVQNYDVNENAFASNDCYNKGATILHNLRCCINNDSLFFKLIRDFAIRYKHKIVTSSDFISMTNEYTKKDYEPFFKKYLYDKRLPVLKYSYRHQGKDIILKYYWDEVDKGFTMPVGLNTITDTYRLEATTEPQEIVLKNAKTIRFYTQWIEPDNAKGNSYTYYWTRCEGYE
jgi:aminopeptidase N